MDVSTPSKRCAPVHNPCVVGMLPLIPPACENTRMATPDWPVPGSGLSPPGPGGVHRTACPKCPGNALTGPLSACCGILVWVTPDLPRSNYNNHQTSSNCIGVVGDWLSIDRHLILRCRGARLIWWRPHGSPARVQGSLGEPSELSTGSTGCWPEPTSLFCGVEQTSWCC